jgi:hypothetical protein
MTGKPPGCLPRCRWRRRSWCCGPSAAQGLQVAAHGLSAARWVGQGADQPQHAVPASGMPRVAGAGASGQRQPHRLQAHLQQPSPVRRARGVLSPGTCSANVSPHSRRCRRANYRHPAPAAQGAHAPAAPGWAPRPMSPPSLQPRTPGAPPRSVGTAAPTPCRSPNGPAYGCLWYGSFRSRTVRVILVRDDKPRTRGGDNRGYGLPLVTTGLESSAEDLVVRYGSRWGIEKLRNTSGDRRARTGRPRSTNGIGASRCCGRRGQAGPPSSAILTCMRYQRLSVRPAQRSQPSGSRPGCTIG